MIEDDMPLRLCKDDPPNAPPNARFGGVYYDRCVGCYDVPGNDGPRRRWTFMRPDLTTYHVYDANDAEMIMRISYEVECGWR